MMQKVDFNLPLSRVESEVDNTVQNSAAPWTQFNFFPRHFTKLPHAHSFKKNYMVPKDLK